MNGKIQIENLSKVFGGNDEEKVVALDGVTAEIPEATGALLFSRQIFFLGFQLKIIFHLDLGRGEFTGSAKVTFRNSSIL